MGLSSAGASPEPDAAAATAALQERLERFADHGDYAAVLDPEALRLACTVLAAACAPGRVAADVAAGVYQVAWLRWFRNDALTTGPEPDRDKAAGEEEMAARLFTLLYRLQPDLVPPSQLPLVTLLAEAGLSRTPAARYATLGDALQELGRTTANPGALRQSTDVYRRALEPGGELDDRPSALFNLSQALRGWFEASRDPSALEEAIAAVRAAEREFRPDDARRTLALQNLAGLLEKRFEDTADEASLEESLQVWRRAVAESEPADPEYPARLSGLSIALRMRYEQAGDRGDLEESVTAAQQAVAAATALGVPAASMMSMLAAALGARYRAGGHPEDLDEAISLDRAATEHAEPGTRERVSYLHNLSTTLSLRYKRGGRAQDLEDSIAAERAALAESAGDHQDPYLAGLAVGLLDRYHRTGRLADLNEAVQAARAVTGPPGVHQAERLSNLSLVLRVLFEHTGDLADIDAAVEAGRAAVAATGSRQKRGAHLTNLSSSLQLRFKRTLDRGDLDAATEASRDAVASCPPGHPDRPGAASVLGLALKMQAEVDGWSGRQEGQSGILDETVTIAREAVAATAADDTGKPGRLANLSEALSVRFAWNRRVADADEALETAQAALQPLPRDHPARADGLAALGRAWHNQSQALDSHAPDLGMLARAFAAWREGSDLPTAPASTRLTCAVRWAQAARDEGLASQAEAAHAAIASLLPLLAWRGLDRATQEYQLGVWGSLATDAAAWAITAEHPEHAIELLEAGRTILWSQLLQTRDETDDLRAAHPDLAERLDQARARLDGRGPAEPGVDAASADLAASGRMRAATDWDDVLAEVRTRPGFESFLSVPSFSHLSAAAANGPVVVINVSQYRCDALVVTPGGIRVIPLPELTLADAERHAAALRTAGSPAGESRAAVQAAIDATLPWLWQAVTAPVLHELGLLQIPERAPLPRVWWCPTGPLTHLPVHAAAPAPAGPGALDCVVSSYTPTLGTLLRTTRTPPGRAHDPQRLLMVTVSETAASLGQRLVGAAQEKAVANSFGGERTCYEDQQASTGPVASAMADHDHAHFACHGSIDAAQPTQSGLRLYDGVLTISALSRLQRQPGGLAFLSACDTAAGSTRHPDEAVTMAAAMHMAGYQHVIATLWYILDRISPAVASSVYAALSTPDGRLNLGDAASALQAVARSLRDAGYPAAQWAPYVHSGP